jgi:hypothetical protein
MADGATVTTIPSVRTASATGISTVGSDHRTGGSTEKDVCTR